MADYVAKQGTTALGIIGTALGGIATVGPAPITLPVGTITLTEADVDAIYNYIMQS